MTTTPSTCFIKDGSAFWPSNTAKLDIHPMLPPETYVVKVHPMRGYFLERTEDMIVPTKLYGETEAHAERIVSTFLARGHNTGALLSGEKGSGKSMLLRQVSRRLAALGMPTIIINDEHAGENFNDFMQSITQPCMVAFDEFEKTYDEQHQNAILTLLDGVFSSHKLFMFTVNRTRKVGQHFMNRPGRMFYNIRFSGLSKEAIEEYCDDTLVDKSQIEGVQYVASTIDEFNFDMLKALIEEMNRYNETATNAVKLMNIRPETSSTVTYDVKVMKDGEEVKNAYVQTHHGETRNPLAEQRTIVRIDKGMEPDILLVITPKDLVMQDVLGDLHFEKDGYNIRFLKTVSYDFAY